MPDTITVRDAYDALYHNEEVVTLDVRLAADFRETHIPGAHSNCVFEVAFMERVSDAYTHNTVILVYGTDAESREAHVAAEKLARGGYTHVRVVSGGLAAWQEEGLPLERGSAVPEPPNMPEGDTAVDTDVSELRWEGRNLTNRHFGTLPVKSGHLTFSSGALTGGRIVLDMCSMHCDDLQGTELHDVLIAHLQGDDFFDVERYPEAVVELTAVRQHPGQGNQNLDISAALTLCNVTRPIQMSASGGLTPEGAFAFQGQTQMLRTEWGIIYGSARFFKRLGAHIVNDHLNVGIKIVTAAP